MLVCYKVPRIVAIGPYHHHRAHLKQAEKVKHAAAIDLVTRSGRLLEDMYGEVASAADDDRRLFDKDVMAGIGYDDFRHMMFFDACFLVQYILMQSGEKIDQGLRGFIGPNRKDIRHDITLLENQLPWKVVQRVMGFTVVIKPVHDPLNWLKRFISIFKGFVQDQKPPKSKQDNAGSSDDDDDEEEEEEHNRSSSSDDYSCYQAPHLLGLLQHFHCRRRKRKKKP
ncbi:hypothetical protein U9M48_000670 [Paspalum notatum var. saurae]|uniref:Uncharacterized protein n=1 Tax=Paspalum notatum var. saurae TaxID=547442 RepID=A0AAQ3PHA1_PASNO